MGRALTRAVADLGLVILPITPLHVAVQAELSFHHRDPFDRLLVAQARVEAVPVVSRDPVFEGYAVPRPW